MQPSSAPEQAEQRRGQRLLFIAALCTVLLTFPLLAIVDRPLRFSGVPVLYLYILAVWLLVVLLTGWLVRHKTEH
ncbi:hypothetical protein [Solirubrum puertoriconensis]|uniref:DUF3311 domain-containing protein n=1 Tax=Solirubrum puertoriconensis TaxID=1751427 RepID=A0A9X0HKV7_SOLP1|nr:hypothetical protein [Solirubrum puertoriconensis]KUG07641.1 hypothetical protein ASU33_15035 [Solirubrum puertoriconensis]